MQSESRTETSSCITIVSGLPRSGTSMMMQILLAGGMQVASDGVRGHDEDNPRGYFELEAVKSLCSETSKRLIESLRGKTVKILSHLLYNLPPEFQYRLIVMRRNLFEVLLSQKAMLERTGRRASDDDRMF